MLKLDLPNCGLKQVDLSPVHCFNNLARFELVLLNLILQLVIVIV